MAEHKDTADRGKPDPAHARGNLKGGGRPEPKGRAESAQGETQAPVPREPFERDESVDAAGEPTALDQHRGRLAHRDIERGVADTSRSAETDATYHRLREPLAAEKETEKGNKKGAR